MQLAERNWNEAELQLRASLTIRQKIEPDKWTTFETMSVLGEALLNQQRLSEAEPLLVNGYQGMKRRQDTIPASDRGRLTRPGNAW